MSEAEQLLDKLMTGFEWNMENKPECMDISDYEFYDEVKSYFEQLKTK